MTWQLAFVTASFVLVAAAAVRSWLHSRSHHQAVARRSRRRHPPAADPLLTLTVQVRLGELARELRAIDDDRQVYARAHHARAAQEAYDALLREACRLAGLGVVDLPTRAGEQAESAERLREELELSSRGWSW
ncbi:hypothetical protein [Krasilnikoviella flava]|uniref:Uncharacterized protein n=1 Tax=Krasilnikoviella flava TaxID=526729 RepID=A0A1T5LHQ0_9MICO|nr:hypothetical protein [Krasilnikoviella flava]SKC75513.1 hypothetical protein SAMN04324258_3442 [Krasilnikoviella flava]